MFKIFIKTGLLFGITQVLAVSVAYLLLPMTRIIGIEEPTTSQTLTTATAGQGLYTILLFALIIIIFTYITLRFKRVSAIAYRLILSFVILSGVQVIILAFNPSASILVALTALLLFWFRRSIITHNIIMILTIAGISVVFGLSLTPIVAAIILIGLSFYDILSVYKTKHMLALASMMIDAKAIFGFIVPEERRSFKDHVSNVKVGAGFFILGSGDIVFPAILSVALVRESVPAALLVAVFSIIGLWLTQFLFQTQETRRPMAALPPIAMMAIIGYVVATVFL